jgi:hypothetical protein
MEKKCLSNITEIRRKYIAGILLTEEETECLLAYYNDMLESIDNSIYKELAQHIEKRIAHISQAIPHEYQV